MRRSRYCPISLSISAWLAALFDSCGPFRSALSGIARSALMLQGLYRPCRMPSGRTSSPIAMMSASILASISVSRVVDDFGDALAGNVLEVAGFEDLGGASRSASHSYPARSTAGDRRNLVAHVHDLVGGVLGGADDGVELVRRGRDVVGVNSLGPGSRRNLVLGVADVLRERLKLGNRLAGRPTTSAPPSD